MPVVLELRRARRARSAARCRGAHSSSSAAGSSRPREVVGLERLDPRLVGQVEVDRRDGDAAVGDRGQVGPLLALVVGRVAVDPVLAPAGLLVLRASARRGRSACRAARPRRRAMWPAGKLMLSSVPPGSGTSSISSTIRAMKAAAASNSKWRPSRKSISRASDCWETAIAGSPSTSALERGGDRARVGDVVAEVGAVVDAGDDQVGLEAVDQPERREADAVDRRAVGRVADRPVAEVDLLDPQRAPRRDRPRPIAERLQSGAMTASSTSRPRAARGAAPGGPRPRSRRRWSAGPARPTGGGPAPGAAPPRRGRARA